MGSGGGLGALKSGVRYLPLLFLVSCGEQPAAAPTSAQQVANGVILRSMPAAIDVAVGRKKAPNAGFFEGEEQVGALAFEGHAKIADETIARLEGSEIIAVAVGSTTLHLESEQPFSGAIDIPIVVHQSEPTALAIEPSGPVRVGESIAIKATATWAEGPSDATYDVEWSTDDALALSANATRAVVPLGEKNGKLRAKLGALEALAVVTPSGKRPVAIEIHMSWTWLDIRRFGAFARYEDGEEREVSAACQWTVEGKPWSDPSSVGPRVRAADLSWNREATCTVDGIKGSGSLFGQ